MNRILIMVITSIAIAGVAGCANWDIGKGKGKGKAPPPVAEEPAPVYK